MITVLTHDPKFDVPLLEVALRLPEVAYVGAMGSRRTHEDRLARLREAGVDDKEIERLSSPIGLDLGARTPEETAISIAAEIVAGRWGGSGERLGGPRRPDPPGPGVSDWTESHGRTVPRRRSSTSTSRSRASTRAAAARSPSTAVASTTCARR